MAKNQYRQRKPWTRVLCGIRARCYTPSCSSFRWYGLKGIENYLSLKDVKHLWFRDKAYLMQKPSIDRIDREGHYTLENCRFIELSQNLSRKIHQPFADCRAMIERELYAKYNPFFRHVHMMYRKIQLLEKFKLV